MPFTIAMVRIGFYTLLYKAITYYPCMISLPRPSHHFSCSVQCLKFGNGPGDGAEHPDNLGFGCFRHWLLSVRFFYRHNRVYTVCAEFITLLAPPLLTWCTVCSHKVCSCSLATLLISSCVLFPLSLLNSIAIANCMCEVNSIHVLHFFSSCSIVVYAKVMVFLILTMYSLSFMHDWFVHVAFPLLFL